MWELTGSGPGRRKVRGGSGEFRFGGVEVREEKARSRAARARGKKFGEAATGR